eukprot:1153281-Pelagomonas_calceolata.AAC.1
MPASTAASYNAGWCPGQEAGLLIWDLQMSNWMSTAPACTSASTWPPFFCGCLQFFNERNCGYSCE